MTASSAIVRLLQLSAPEDCTPEEVPEAKFPAPEDIGEDEGDRDEPAVTRASTAVVTLAVTLGAAEPEIHAREVGKTEAVVFGFVMENKGLQLLVLPATMLGIWSGRRVVKAEDNIPMMK